MTTRRSAAGLATTLALLLAAGPRLSPAQAPAAPAAATTAPAPAPPPSPVAAIRNKLSAGDLLSAESVLEVHREKNGEDGAWLQGLAWLARGALIMGDLPKAGRYAAQVRAECAKRIAAGTKIEADHDLEIALGAAIETDAQRIQRTRGKAAAVRLLRAEIARYEGPTTLLLRLHKRLDMLTLVGTPAPEIVAEDF